MKLVVTDLVDGIDAEAVGVTISVSQGIAGLTQAEADALYAPIGAGGAVDSVNGHTGVVVLAASDVGADASGAASAAQAAAASDATTKANAAQAAAVQRANHTGTQSADTLTDGTTNKAFLATERTKLAGIATGATANASDATLEDRANHTGTQAESTVTGLVSDLAAKAPLASPALTGTPTVPTAAGGTNTTQAASTAFVHGEVATEATARSNADALLAPLASPALTGNPTAPTQSAGNNSTRLATTAYVATAVAAGGGGGSTDPHPFIFQG